MTSFLYQGQCLTSDQILADLNTHFPYVASNGDIVRLWGQVGLSSWDATTVEYVTVQIVNGQTQDAVRRFATILTSDLACTSPGPSDFDSVYASQVFALSFSIVLGFFFLALVVRGIYKSLGL